RAPYAPHSRPRGRARSLPDRARTRRAPRKRLAPLRANAVGGPWTRLDPGRALAAEALLGAREGAAAKLRRPGRHCDPERAPLQRDARSAGAADGDRQRLEGD